MIEWFDPVKKEPDDEQTVLLLVPDASEPVWPGFVSDGVWYWASGSRVDSTVVGWCEMPNGTLKPVGQEREGLMEPVTIYLLIDDVEFVREFTKEHCRNCLAWQDVLGLWVAHMIHERARLEREKASIDVAH